MFEQILLLILFEQIVKEAEAAPAEEESDQGAGSKVGLGLWDKFRKVSAISALLQAAIHDKDEMEYPRVNLTVVYPNALTPKQVSTRGTQGG